MKRGRTKDQEMENRDSNQMREEGLGSEDREAEALPIPSDGMVVANEEEVEQAPKAKRKMKRTKKGSYVDRARRSILKKRLANERMISLSTSTGEEDEECLPEFEELDSDLAEEISNVLSRVESDTLRDSMGRSSNNDN